MKNPTFAKQSSQPFRGFTLVELLVVISIIIVLAALSFAGFSKMRKSAYKVVSFRNISQIQIANVAYAAEHNGKYVPVWESDDTGKPMPGSSYWFENTELLRNLRGEPKNDTDFNVPLAMMDPIAVAAAKKRGVNANNIQLSGSYGYNNTAIPGKGAANANSGLGNNASPAFRVEQVVNPSRTAAFITCTGYIVSYEERFLWKNQPNEGKGGISQKMAYRYDNKAIVVYYDGHVNDMSMDDINKIDYQGGQSGASGDHAPFWRASDLNAIP